MALPPGLEALMRDIPPMGGRTAPGVPDLAAGGAGALPGAPPAPGGAPAPGASRPGAPGGGSDIFSQVVNATQSKAGGTDPQYFLDQLNQMKTVVASMLTKSLLKYPGQVDRQVQNLLRAIDATSKAYQEAGQHQAAMSGSPIDFAGAQAGAAPGMPVGV